MTKVKITAVAKQLPNYDKETKDIIPFLDIWLQGQEERFKRKVVKLFENAGVDKRYSIMEPEEVFTKTSFEDKNEIYSREVVPLAEQSLLKALKKASLNPRDIDYIITPPPKDETRYRKVAGYRNGLCCWSFRDDLRQELFKGQPQ